MVIKINKHILVMFMGQFGVFRSAIQTPTVENLQICKFYNTYKISAQVINNFSKN
jgi:hypothetical protein